MSMVFTRDKNKIDLDNPGNPQQQFRSNRNDEGN